MRRTSFAGMSCPVAQSLEVIGDPWTMLVVREAFFGTTRFDDLQRNLGIPRTTLVARLDHLVAHGILERRQYQERPPRHGYHLTPKGRDLRPVMVTLMQWGDRWGDVEDELHLEDAATGRRLEPDLVDAGSGTPIAELRTRVVRTPRAVSGDDAARVPAVPQGKG
ncbi:MAG: helix-turn-helix transcriptional regulator [Actinomycetota bacterium]|nr:helix-turn-helix transcriptional regulator [Actinomycetota bacterium]